jgi:hypothetical protein
MLVAMIGIGGATSKKQFAVKGTSIIMILCLTFYFMQVLPRHHRSITLSTGATAYNHNLYSWWTTLQHSQSRQTIRITNTVSPSSTSQPSCPPLSECPPPSSLYDRTKLAFLVETRPLPHLPALFAHMTNLVPPEWTFKFMGSPTAIAFMRSSLLISRLEASGKLSIVPLPSNYTLSDRESISQMFTDPHLYKNILAPAENLLVFQPDSIFCANAPTTLNDFLEWDWIGAPWSSTAKYGGNGGLSLRKVSKVLEVLEGERRTVGDGALEDLWLSSRLNGLEGARIPNATVSKTFSVESVWDDMPLGYHIGWLGVHHEQVKF